MCRDVYCEYQFDEETFKTPIIPGQHTDPIFDYTYQHTISSVTENMIKYLKENAICFKVFGLVDIDQKMIEQATLDDSESNQKSLEVTMASGISDEKSIDSVSLNMSIPLKEPS